MSQTYLDTNIMIRGFSQGCFPMPDIKTGVIAWYRPDPRAIIPLDGFHTSKSLSRLINKKLFQITYNQSFPQVLQECANRKQTWINHQFIETYTQLHKDGFAQSIEVWHQKKLVGGLYGIQLARAFFAESMFYKVSNSSKVALYYLVQKLREKNFLLLECQFMTEHLKRLGAVEIYDRDYMRILKKALQT